MLFDYDVEMPEWAEAEEYSFCRNLTEKKVLRVVLTWLTFVNLRYRPKTLRYASYSVHSGGCLRSSQMERLYKNIANAVPDDRDPAHLVACTFEMWDNRDKYHVYVKEGLEELGGLAFPSLRYMYTNAEKLAEIWLAIPNYKPKDFVPIDDMKKKDTQVVESKISRWCVAYNKKPVQFWTNPHEVQLLDARYMKCSTSLLQCREEVEKYWSCTVEEFIDFMLVLQGEIEKKEDEIFLVTKALNAERVKRGYEPEYPNLPTLEDE